MKILLPTHQISSRGVGTIIRGLCASLPQELDASDELVIVGSSFGVNGRGNVKHLPHPRFADARLGRVIYEQSVLPRTARTADLIHLCDHRPLLASQTPFLLTVTDVFFLDRPDWFPYAVARYKQAMLSAALAKKPQAIICVSEYTKARLFAHHPGIDRARVRVIYPGVLTAPDEGDALRKPDAPYFLTVATIEPRKNHLTLLEAFRDVRRLGIDLRWKLAGAPGDGSKSIVAALRAQVGVDLLGQVSDAELDELYQGALFLAAPSYAEGFGFPPLEAMSRGVPVICSKGSAMDETVGDGALRIASTDASAWGEALRVLASESAERERLKRLGLRRVSRFSLAAAARSYVSCYREALASARLEQQPRPCAGWPR